ncbi:MAG TPA: hypothetical protein PLP17_15070, partial [Oligoflexia bacterium]|nr:hypothetical protein [Oligoflexia bacterium]
SVLKDVLRRKGGLDAFALIPVIETVQNLQVFRHIKDNQERQQRQTLHRPCATSAFTRVTPQIRGSKPLSGGILVATDLFAYSKASRVLKNPIFANFFVAGNCCAAHPPLFAES